MEFEVLKRSHLKRNIVIAVVVVAIISAIILTFTRAKFKNTESIPLVNGTINYSLADLNIVAIKVDGREVDTLPDGNYELTSESYCTINNEKNSSIKLNYDSNTKALSVTPMTTKGTKCYLDFKKRNLAKETLDKLGLIVNDNTPNFNQIATTNEGVYKTEDDWGESYYFRGAVDNNWVKFAGYYWRIIRINGDGSIRLIYNGTSTQTTGDTTLINNGINQAFNTNYNRNEYVGYMYTINQQHGNGTSSSIKTVIDSWYSSNLASYSDKISKEAGFCGDREPSTSSTTSNGSGGTGTTTTYYGGYIKLVNSKDPTLKCKNSSDLYTVSGSSKGNQALSNPIGLITADEVAYAGGVYGQTNTSYYLYNDTYYWTMSPYRTYPGGSTSAFLLNSNGNLDASYVHFEVGVRPVINLASDVTIKSGNGSSSTPYEI